MMVCDVTRWYLAFLMFLSIMTALQDTAQATEQICPRKCICIGRKRVNITCTKKWLRSVPSDIPANTVSLDLSMNKIPVIKRDDFAGLRQLRVLDLSKNIISIIKRDDLAGLRQLEILDLSHNRIINFSPSAFNHTPNLKYFQFGANRYRNLRLINDVLCPLQKTKVVHLQIQSLNIKQNVSSELFNCLTKLKLVYLDLSRNDLGPLPDYFFGPLQTLQDLRVDNSNPAPVAFNPMAYANLSSLESLSLCEIHLTSIPRLITAAGDPILPNLRKLYLNRNQIKTVDAQNFRGLWDLRILSLDHNLITKLSNSPFSHLTLLKDLSLYFNPLRTVAVDSFSLPSLIKLDLGKSVCQFENGNPFKYIPNLQHLLLGGVNLYTAVRRRHSIFAHLTNLVRLNMQSTSLNSIPTKLFKNLFKLKKLLLNDNKISHVDSVMFDDLTSLDTLDFGSNKISNVNASSFPRHFESHLVNISLAANPFRCDCNLLWFRNWMNHTNTTVLFTSHKGQYTCKSPQELSGTSLLDYNPTSEECRDRHIDVGLVLSISIPGIIASILIMSILGYKYRWYLRYCYFLLRARVKQYQVLQDDRDYKYDAFVSYNSQDINWIKYTLLPKIEDEAGFKVCLHDRDWLPGPDIVDNIVQSIQNSRKTMLIVSNAFAKSQWCQLELTMAQHRLFEEDKNNMILVVLEDIEADNVTPRLALQMKRKTFIMWTEDPMGQKLFWKNLEQSLGEPDTSFMQEIQSM